MNFLAHAYLSFNQPEVLLGNLISDFVKGKSQYSYPQEIYKGIRLHRQIDDFTDCHPQTQKAKALLKPVAGRYAGVFVDILYDYFLANDSSIFSEKSLLDFSLNTYKVIEGLKNFFPKHFNFVFERMVANNWLYHYRFEFGIQKSIENVYRRALYLEPSDNVFICFKQNFDAFKNCYENFFPELESFSKNRIDLVTIK